MNSAKIFATIVTAIALFPAASWADNVSGNSQTTDLSSQTLGTGNVSVMQTKQAIVNAQNSGFFGTNAAGTNQHITGHTTTIGDGNIDVKDAAQKALTIQKN